MKLSDLSPVLRSATGHIQYANVYNTHANALMATSCTIDYAVKHYGDWHLERITAAENFHLVLHVH